MVARRKATEKEPTKVEETQRKNRVTETQRKPDTAMPTKDRGRDEMGWRHREMGVSERARERQVEGESERAFFSCGLSLRRLGPWEML